jgi:hypothetical protein
MAPTFPAVFELQDVLERVANGSFDQEPRRASTGAPPPLQRSGGNIPPFRQISLAKRKRIVCAPAFNVLGHDLLAHVGACRKKDWHSERRVYQNSGRPFLISVKWLRGKRVLLCYWLAE